MKTKLLLAVAAAVLSVAVLASSFLVDSERLMAISTVALALITLVLAGATIFLAVATDELVQQAAAASAMELRAYMIGASACFRSEDREHFIDVTMTNFGKTPARDVIYWASTLSAPKRAEVTPPDEINRVRLGVIPPGGSHTITFPVPLLVTGEEVEAGKYALFVFGEIKYHDGFVGARSSSFQFKRTGKHWTRDGELEISENGNEAE